MDLRFTLVHSARGGKSHWSASRTSFRARARTQPIGDGPHGALLVDHDQRRQPLHVVQSAGHVLIVEDTLVLGRRAVQKARHLFALVAGRHAQHQHALRADGLRHALQYRRLGATGRTSWPKIEHDRAAL